LRVSLSLLVVDAFELHFTIMLELQSAVDQNGECQAGNGLLVSEDGCGTRL